LIFSSITFSIGIDLQINLAIGTGVKNCPASCFNHVVKRSSKKSHKKGCFFEYLNLYFCNSSTTSFKTFAFSSKDSSSFTSFIANSLLF